jgi:hypothetical protein
MSRESRQRQREAKQHPRKKKFLWILPLCAIVAIASGVAVWNHQRTQPQQAIGIVAKPPASFRQPQTFKELLALSPAQLEQCDKQGPTGDYRLSKDDLKKIIGTGVVISTVENCLASHVEDAK